MKKVKNFYIITDNLTLMKVDGEKMSNIIEFYLSPLSIRYGIKNSNAKKLIKTLEKELKRQDEKRKRTCSECGKQMTQGYCIENGMEYYCSDECLHKNMTQDEYLELYDNGNGDSYWTEWED